VHDLTGFSLSDMIACEAAFRTLGKGAASMEEVAERIVRYLYDHLVDQQTGERSCLLVRCFKTHPFDDLGPELRHIARDLLGRQPESPGMKCLTLLATAGVRPEWNSRRTSAGHRAIPLPGVPAVGRLPMIDQLIKQFGLEVDAVLDPDPAVVLEPERETYDVFHVPRAEGSPYVPAQDEFVIPYGVRSVLGFGGLLPRGDLFAVILFARVPIACCTAALFRPLALSVKAAVLPFLGRPVFAPDPEGSEASGGEIAERDGPTDVRAQRVEAREAALERLLEMLEQAALGQSTQLEQARAELRLGDQMFHTLANMSPVGIYRTDVDGAPTYVNGRLCEMAGLSVEEALRGGLERAQHPDDRAQVRSAWYAAAAEGVPFQAEYRYQRPDGVTTWVFGQGMAERGDAGEVIGYVGTVTDITARKHTEEALLRARAGLERQVEQRTAELVAANEALRGEIADRQKAEAAVRESEERLRLFVENTPAAVAMFDRNLRYLSVSRRWLTDYGLGDRDIIGRYHYDVFPEIPERWKINHRRVLAGEVLRGDEDPFPRKDGRIDWVRWEERPWRDNNGEIGGMIMFTEVITERKRAEEALRQAHDELERRVEERTAELSQTNARLKREIVERERTEVALRNSEGRYRQLTEGTRDAIVVASQDGLITLFNPAAQETFGFSERDVLGQPLTVLMPPGDRDAYREGLRRYLKTRESRVVGRTVELRGLRKDGETFPLELTLTAFDLPEGTIFLGAIRDVTARHRMQARLVQSEKLASLGLLSAGVAHEINNPLAYVANNLAVLERDIRGLTSLVAAYEQGRTTLESARPDLAAEVAELAETIDLTYVKEHIQRVVASTRQGIKRVADIVQNLRGFARLDQAAVDRVNVHDAIESSLEMIRGRLARRDIVVEQHFDDVSLVECSPAQINQVFMNLLINAMQAIEATSREGRIEIRTRAAGDEVIVEVADNGCGIPAGELPRIFDPFFTTKLVGEGTGLGLSISHGIVSDHGGRIEVESTPGQGSRFRVVLPIGGRGKGRPAEQDSRDRPA
jgi:two-component system NtrC family sensor kinase